MWPRTEGPCVAGLAARGACPAEATAVGNVLMQAIGAGVLANLEEARGVVRRSFPLEVFAPQRPDGWATAFEKYRSVAAR